MRRFIGTLRRPISALGGLGLGADFDYAIGLYQELGSVRARQAFLRTLRAVVDWKGQVVMMLDRAYLTRHLPTMLIWGENVTVVPARHAAVAHGALPHSRLEMFAGARHFPHHDDPVRFVRVLREFIAQTAPNVHDARRWRATLAAGAQPPADAPPEQSAASSGS